MILVQYSLHTIIFAIFLNVKLTWHSRKHFYEYLSVSISIFTSSQQSHITTIYYESIIELNAGSLITFWLMFQEHTLSLYPSLPSVVHCYLVLGRSIVDVQLIVRTNEHLVFRRVYSSWFKSFFSLCDNFMWILLVYVIKYAKFLIGPLTSCLWW